MLIFLNFLFLYLNSRMNHKPNKNYFIKLKEKWYFNRNHRVQGEVLKIEDK